MDSLEEVRAARADIEAAISRWAQATASLRDEDHSDEYPPLGQVIVTSMVWAAEVSSLNPEMDGFAGRWTAAPASQSMSASAGLGGYIQRVFLA